MRSKRGQMEMLGLAIIMVIVLLGILIALRFFFLVTPVDPTKNARDVQLGANLIDTMLETTMGCNDVKLSVLLRDCNQGGAITCRGFSPTDGDMTSCVYATEAVTYLLNSTLGTWKRDYEFEIEGTSNPGLLGVKSSSLTTGCTGSFQKITRPRPIGGSTITLVLKLCQ